MSLPSPRAGRPVSLALPTAALAVLTPLAALVAVSWGSGAEAVAGGRSTETATIVLLLLAVSFAAYMSALAVLRKGARLAAVVVCACVIQLLPLGAPLLLSTDAWSYWAYGWQATHGSDPYRDPPATRPDNPALPWMGEAWRETSSVYGPVFTALSEPVALAAGTSPDRAAWLFKTLAAAATLAAACFAARRSSRPAFAAAVVGWNPLLAVHAAGGGHNDALVGALLAAALAAAAAGRSRPAALLWPPAVLVKWIAAPVLLLAAAARWSRTRRPVTRADVAAAGVAVAGSFALFGTGWLESFVPLAANAARETSYAFPARLEQLGLPRWAAIAAGIGLILVALAWLTVLAARGRPRYGLSCCALLVGTPYLAVWYLAWALPVVAGDDDGWALAVALALSVYLLPQTIPT